MVVKRVLYYGLGGGLGHLSRSRAIISAILALNSNISFTLITNSLYTKLVFPNFTNLILVKSIEELSKTLKEILLSPFDLLIIDTFARGLMGELTEWLEKLPYPKVLIQRYLNENYVKSFPLKEFVTTHFQQVLRLADNLPKQDLSPKTIDIPAVILNKTNIISNLEINSPSPSQKILFVDFGLGADSYLKALSLNYSFQIVSPSPEHLNNFVTICQYPISQLLSQADLIIGGCGYNLYHEVMQSGKPAIFLPQKKTYDDQFGRAKESSFALSPNELVEILSHQKVKPSKPLSYGFDGDKVAAELILSLLN